MKQKHAQVHLLIFFGAISFFNLRGADNSGYAGLMVLTKAGSVASGIARNPYAQSAVAGGVFGGVLSGTVKKTSVGKAVVGGAMLGVSARGAYDLYKRRQDIRERCRDIASLFKIAREYRTEFKPVARDAEGMRQDDSVSFIGEFIRLRSQHADLAGAVAGLTQKHEALLAQLMASGQQRERLEDDGQVDEGRVRRVFGAQQPAAVGSVEERLAKLELERKDDRADERLLALEMAIAGILNNQPGQEEGGARGRNAQLEGAAHERNESFDPSPDGE